MTQPRWCTQCCSAYRADFARCPIDGAVITESETDPLIGMTFGHYVIDSFLGEGAMSRVYRAHHALLSQKQFAVKVMVGDLAATLEMRLRFAQEADAASQLDHPNVVSVVDFGKSEGGLMFIAMELVTGRSLATVIEEEAPLDGQRALAITRQIALGLQHAHDKGLVHRDLKPDNVVISGSPERVQIVDFGLAIPVDEDRSARLTNVGLAVGTPSYAAPEQTHDEIVDHRADLFALGVTLYEMLAGKPPFDGGVAEVIRGNASDALPAIATRAGVAVDPAVEAIVRTLTRREARARFASAQAVVEAIDELESAEVSHRIESLIGARLLTQEQAVASTIGAAPTPPARRRRWVGYAAVATLAMIGGIVAFVLATQTTSAASQPVDSAPVALTPPPAIREPVRTEAPPAEATSPAPRDPEPPPVVAAPTKRVPVPGKPARSPTARVDARTRDPVDAPTEAAASVPARSEAPPPAPAEPAPVVAPAPPRPTEVPPRITPPPPPPAEPLRTSATTSITGLSVRGSLTEADVRRAIEKGLPSLRACYQQIAQRDQKSPAVTVRITLAFDDSRQSTASHALAPGWSALGACVKSAASGFRVQTAPDVGTVDVIVDIAFKPVAP